MFMIVDTKFACDHLGNPLARPQGPAKTMRFRTLPQQIQQMFTLPLVQFGRCTADSPSAQSGETFRLPDAHDLTHSSLADAQRFCDRLLRRGGQPSTLLQMARAFPRAQRALRATLDILL